MTTEIWHGTDSAMSDHFKEFLTRFKDDTGHYKYQDTIDADIFLDKIIEIDWDDFTNETKSIFENRPLNDVWRALHRAIVEFHQIKVGSMVDVANRENRIKFSILNNNKFVGRIFDNSYDLTENEQKFESLQKSIPKGELHSSIEWLVEYYIIQNDIISKLDIIQEIKNWLEKLEMILGKDVPKKVVDIAIENIFSKPYVHSIILKIAFDMGLSNKKILFHKSQIQETGEYIKAKYHMKRFGDLIGEVEFHNGVFYEGNAENKILMDSNLILFQSTNAQRREVFKYIESSLEIIDLDRIDDYVTMIPCLNGIYNVKTGEFKEGFNPEIIVFDQMPFNYDNSVKRGKVKEIVEFILQNNRARTNFFDWCSCAFLTYTGLTFMKIFESKAGMGKTTLANYIRCIVGRKSIGEPKYHVLIKDATTRIDMHRKRVLIDSEMSEKTPDELSTFKKWILQEYNTDRSIYGHNVDYRPTPIMMGIANRLFEIADETELEAMADRADIDKLTRRIRDRNDEVIKDIKNVMMKTFESNPKEGDAELTFLLNNATKIYKKGKVNSRQPRDVVMQMWNRLGNLVRQFTQMRMMKIENGWITNEKAWVAWQEYCIPKNIDIGERLVFLEKFRKVMNLDKPIHRRISGTDKFEWGYNGVRLLSEGEIENLEQQKLREYQS